MLRNLSLLVILLSACNSAADMALSPERAEQIVNDYINSKNENYDGGGVVEATMISIGNIELKNDTAWIHYKWSGRYKPPPLPQDIAPEFNSVNDREEQVMLVKDHEGWRFATIQQP